MTRFLAYVDAVPGRLYPLVRRAGADGPGYLFPTRKVIQSFAPITRDNRLVLTMEWIAEAILLCAPIFTLSAALFLTGAFP